MRAINPASSPKLLAAAAVVFASLTNLRAAPEPRVTFADSIGRRAAIAAPRAMTADHLADPVGFNIPLPLRNQPELEARVNAGEVLSGAELREKYFPLPADYDAVAAWLKGEGFAVDAIGDAHLAVFAHGAVSQVQSSFETTMGLITAKGADHAVARTAPSLPASIARRVLGVSGLSYRRPQRRLVHPAAANVPQPDAIPSGGYHINDIAKVYGGSGLVVNNTPLTGAGQIIAVESYTTLGTSDYNLFWKNNAVTRTGALKLINSGATTISTPAQDPDDAEEAALDIEWAGGMAPGADLNVYATTYDDNDSPERNYNKAISDGAAATNPIRQFTSSYGPTEAELNATELSAFNQIFLSMTAEGMTYINATGDIGSGSGGLQPEAYGVFPYTLGVGGTTLNITTTTSDIRSTETGWTGSSGGISAKFGRPAWQVGAGIGTGSATGTMRLFPDIALAANPNTGAYFIFNGSAGQIGGTSWSSPTFAGFLALIHQGRAANVVPRKGVGFLNPRLYPLIGTANFFDVTGGKNGAYTATKGYDLVTGIGAPTISNLLATLLGPTITSLAPAAGAAGTSVVITGTNFYTGPTVPLAVTFNGTAAASITINNPTQITAVVPSGATAGPVAVTSFGDKATSAADFVVGVPDLTVTSSHSGSFAQGDAADTYTLTVANGGGALTSGTVTVTDTLPSGLTATGLTGTGWLINADHRTASRSDALAAGASYPALTLTVSVSPSAPASVTNSVAVSGGGETNTGNDVFSDATTINASLTPIQSWRDQYFGTADNSGMAADSANPAGDGINNLTKYALGLNPLMAEPSPITESITADGHLQLTAPKNPNATDITYLVQVTGDLSNSSSWTSNGVTITTNSSTLLQAYDGVATTAAGRRFIRLQISR